jgi:hypothetical protein
LIERVLVAVFPGPRQLQFVEDAEFHLVVAPLKIFSAVDCASLRAC